MTTIEQWSLSIFEMRDYVKKRKMIWMGGIDSYPSGEELASFPVNMDGENIMLLVHQILSNAPIVAIPKLLQYLCCNSRRKSRGLTKSNQIDTRVLATIAESKNTRVCGIQFKKGDILWNCRQCGKDDTCVQCDSCFSQSDHKDHEY